MAILLTHARATRPTQLVRLFIGILLLLLIVGAVVEDLLEKARFTFEVPLLLWIHQFAAPSLNHLALDLSLIGRVGVIAPLSAVIPAFLWWKYRSLAYFWALSVGRAAALNVNDETDLPPRPA